MPFSNRTHTVVCLIKLLSAVTSHLKCIQTCYYHHYHYHQHHIFQNSICSCFYLFFFRFKWTFPIQMNFLYSNELTWFTVLFIIACFDLISKKNSLKCSISEIFSIFERKNEVSRIEGIIIHLENVSRSVLSSFYLHSVFSVLFALFAFCCRIQKYPRNSCHLCVLFFSSIGNAVKDPVISVQIIVFVYIIH